MKLNRRDAITALAAAGVAVGGGSAVLQIDDGRRGGTHAVDTSEMTTLVAAAEVLYPSEVENVEEFVTRYVRGRAEDRPGYGEGVADAVAYLDEYADAWFDVRFAALDRPAREEALRQMDADTAEPAPAGSDVERVRYYVVNELLYALYTTPTGGELVGIENPQGYPGGTTSYRRPPE